MKKMKALLQSQKGFISMLVTILLLIGVLVIAYLLDSNSQDFVIREVEGIMDVSAINTFNRTISVEKLKDEVFGFDTGGEIKPTDPDKVYTLPKVTEDLIKNTYKDELNRQVSKNSLILEMTPLETRLEFAKGIWGGGFRGKSRPYLVLESVVKVRLKHSQAFDYSSTYQNRKFASYKSGVTDITVKNLGTPKDGEMVMVIHCTSRLFHR